MFRAKEVQRRILPAVLRGVAGICAVPVCQAALGGHWHRRTSGGKIKRTIAPSAALESRLSGGTCQTGAEQKVTTPARSTYTPDPATRPPKGQDMSAAERQADHRVPGEAVAAPRPQRRAYLNLFDSELSIADQAGRGSNHGRQDSGCDQGDCPDQIQVEPRLS